MPKFQKDDVVKCIDASNTPNLVEGTTYRVDDCNEYYIDISIDCHYDYVNGKFPPSKFSPDRFELSSGKPTYVWPMYTTHFATTQYFKEDEDVEESSYEELKARLEQAEELLDSASLMLRKMQNYYKSAMGEELQAEIDLFLE